MKRFILVAILFGISCSVQAQKMYVSAGIGNQSDFGTGVLIAAGLNQITVINKIPIAAEVGYQGYGSTSVYGASISGYALYGAGVASLPINPKLDAIGKVGIALEHADAAVCSPFGGCYTGSANSNGLLFGAGIEYKATNKISVVGDYVSYNGDAVIGAHVKYNF